MSQDKKGRRRRLDPDDVILRRVRPSARELVSLIHEVNPSGLGLPAREEAHRYVQKNRLQSLLVRRFADEIEVRPDPSDACVVGLRHRSSGADACHAILASLDEDARAWLQLQIDLGVHEEVEPPKLSARIQADARSSAATPPDPHFTEGSLEDLLRAGNDALDAYEYDVARERLSLALQRSPGRIDAALALLTLLVDHVALDRDALDLEPVLVAPARKHPEVRRLLALAAARCGERDRAVGLVKDQDAPPVADVFVALARGALAAHDLERAQRDVAEAKVRDPLHPEILRLSDTITARRAALCFPLEQEILQLAREGRLEEAEARVAELLSEDPDNAVARRILRTRDERRAREACRKLLEEAAEARQRGERAHAVSLMSKAIVTDPTSDHAALARAQIAEIEAGEQDRLEHLQAEETLAALGREDRAPGLIAYLALAARPRARVRERAALAELMWLDEIGAEGTGAPARAAALAVAALAQAQATAAGDPEGALAFIAPHEKILQRVKSARELGRQAQRALDERRAAPARLLVQRAQRAFAEVDLDGCEALLEEARFRDLPPDERASAEELKARLERALEQRALVASFEDLRAEAIPFRARDVAQKLGSREGASPGERARWVSVAAEMTATIQAHFRVQAPREGGVPSPLRDFDVTRIRGAARLLGKDGREIVLVESCGEWNFVRVLRASSGSVTRSCALRPPKPLHLIKAVLEDERLTLIGADSSVLALAIDDFTIVDYADLSDLSAPNPIVEDADLAPGGRYLWMNVRAQGQPRTLRIVDLPSRRVIRESQAIPQKGLIRSVAGLIERRVVTVQQDDILVVRDVSASQAAGIGKPMPLIGETVAAHPGGSGLVALAGNPRREAVLQDPDGCPVWIGEGEVGATDGARSVGEGVGWVELTMGGAPHSGPLRPRIVEGLDGRAPAALASSAEVRMVFALFQNEQGAREIVGFDASGMPGSGLSVAYRARVPPRTVLVQDATGWRVVAITLDDEGVEARALGREPPSFSRADAPATSFQAVMPFLAYCHLPGGERLLALRRLAVELRQQPEETQQRRVREEHDIDRLIDLYHAADIGVLSSLMRATFEKLLGRKWFHRETSLQRARFAACNGSWRWVWLRLALVRVGKLDAAQARHLFHLQGTALLWLGLPKMARRALEKGALHPGRCSLDAALALATPVSKKGCDAEPALRSPVYAGVRELVQAVHEADERLECGDPAGAIRAMDRPITWEARELQSLARLAQAYLTAPEPRGDAFLRKAFALVAFRDAYPREGELFVSRRELPIPGARLGGTRLKAILDGAKRWLAECFRGV